MVTGLALRGKELMDLSPLRALVGLQMLRTNCSSLVDLSPLNGMSITNLIVEGCRVTDLSPVARMPLEACACTARKSATCDQSPASG